MITMNRRTLIIAGAGVLAVVAVLAALVLVFAFRKPAEVLPKGGNPIPTPVPGEEVGPALASQAAAAPEETFQRYIHDSIAAQVALQQAKVNMRQRYQNPDITAQDLGGIVTDISVLDDRTTFTLPQQNVSNAHAEFDIRLTFADGDSETRTCSYQVNMQQGVNSAGAAVWYVINPDAFPVFNSCTVK
jgi:hypothetical protein